MARVTAVAVLLHSGLAGAALQAGKYTGKVQFPDSSAEFSIVFQGEADHVQAKVQGSPPLDLQGEASGDAVLCRMRGKTVRGEALDLIGNCWGLQYNGTITIAAPNGTLRRGKFDVQLLQDKPDARAEPPAATRAAPAAKAAPAHPPNSGAEGQAIVGEAPAVSAHASVTASPGVGAKVHAAGATHSGRHRNKAHY